MDELRLVVWWWAAAWIVIKTDGALWREYGKLDATLLSLAVIAAVAKVTWQMSADLLA